MTLIGELEKRLVIDPPRTYHRLWREVKDLLLLAKRDFPQEPKPPTLDPSDEELWETAMELAAWGVRVIAWSEKWLGNHSPIETMTTLSDIKTERDAENFADKRLQEVLRRKEEQLEKFGVVNKRQEKEVKK